MLLCLDVGNTQIHGGVFDGDTLLVQFRKSTSPLGTTDELGIFFTAVLRENGIDPRKVTSVAICSVVPAALYSLRGAAEKYFRCEPFILQAGVKTGLKIKYRNPLEVGADRIANAIAAVQRHPARDLLVVDLGTATTIEVITATGDYLGGAILPGVGVSAETLASHTAKLPRVEIARPEVALGRSSVESIQSGLFHGHVGAVRHLISLVSIEAFNGRQPQVIGTGGFARMFLSENLFDEVVPELVLYGLRHAHTLNQTAGE
ncbi:type III pantothenate kinase [Opitutus sp. GAS368]|jgi:type III pantothenate kinase|uniref:type III pantothenate kinase n=1 Tax=Opitutus sp. GAS368 TaxID=1882749 RepID=UPI0008792BDD|nr:type III pantothenate kinase [Opitutus sp. GAS368]SDR67228.1 pantothenate kinase [Opitutus sp. GAS368]